MIKRAKRLAVIAFLAFAATAINTEKQPTANAAAMMRGEAVGVNFNCQAASNTDMAAVYGAFSQAHAGWVRIYLPWFPIEPKPGQFDTSPNSTLEKFQACVDQANQAGLKVLVVFLNNPSWASKAWNTAPNPKTYASALRYLAKRFRKQVSAWEVWNEENTKFFWRGTAVQYVRVLRAAYKAVKKANPNALVVFGGTAHNDAGWVKKCYQAGAQGSFDVMATHPYPRIRSHVSMWKVIGSVYRVRNVMAANHDSHIPIWFTEFGWSRSAFSSRHQAKLLSRSYNYIASRLPYVQESFWYEAKTEDPQSMQNRWIRGLSLLRPSGAPTPAFQALSRYSASAVRANGRG